MEDIHRIFSEFKEQFPEVFRREEELGREIHLNGGPLTEETRWLVKVAISAAAGRHRALETHIAKAREAGVDEESISQVLLLLIPTVGFPACMEAYQTYRAMP